MKRFLLLVGMVFLIACCTSGSEYTFEGTWYTPNREEVIIDMDKKIMTFTPIGSSESIVAPFTITETTTNTMKFRGPADWILVDHGDGTAIMEFQPYDIKPILLSRKKP